MQISGTDDLKIHLGAEPDDLLADLAELNRIATTESPAPEFDAIARVRPLKVADERRPELDGDSRPCSGIRVQEVSR